MTKRFVKLRFLILVILDMLLAQSTIAFAQQRDSYIGSGAEASIKQYLCTPTPANQNAQTVAVTNIGVSGEQAAANAAFNNQGSGDLYICINRLYRFAIVVAAAFGVLMIVVAGYVYM